MTCPRARSAATRVAGEVVLGRGVDGLERARLPELDVLAPVELHLLEQVEAPRREVILQIRRIAPARRVDHPRVDAGRAGGDLAPLEDGDAAAVEREVKGGRRARDASPHDGDLGVDRSLSRHDPGSVAHSLRSLAAGTRPGRTEPTHGRTALAEPLLDSRP